ncbi:uncharacterized protein LOC123534678 isoform X2 [Mercenaria mercenaria]|uniref:uncharacterized protein LOC123534678 isoform X2 n=1 Tax=Mercenaria mercenaria TaxID=6596 RepID=UPI001E1D69A9|nr:uncharacterized protein LOC123534678 isoform X2 [Mercenaria mercenaria]
MTIMMLGVSKKNSLILLAIFLSIAYFVSGNKCTNVLGKNEIHEVVVKEPCIQKYTARCGWLSLNYCTFYHNTYCDKKVNETIKKYYVKTECCKGFLMARNGSCIKMKPGVIYDIRTTPPSVSSHMSAVDPNHKEDPVIGPKKEKRVKMEISGGGYAGIACGLILIVTIVAFIIIAVRKRKKKQELLKAHQTEQVLYVGADQPIVRNSGSRSSRTPSVQFSRSSREATPSSSRMVTPPTSPLKTALPVEQPLINKNLTDEDIPESNV